MKKRLVVLLAGLLTVLSLGFGLAQFSDVPAGHWAKEAVEALAAKGLILGFPDGTFRGNENLTRYQAALIIYRLLQQIEEELKAQGTSPTMEAMAPEDLEVLKNAVQELAAELAALGVRVSALEDSAATKEDIARLEALIEELRAQPMPEAGMDEAALQDLADRVEAASIAADTALAQAQQLAEQLQALSEDVEGVKGEVASLSTQVEANAQAIQALNELAVLLNQDVLSLQDRVTALEKGLADLQGVNFEEFATKEDVAAVQEFAAALRSDLVSLSEKVSKLEAQVADLSKVQYSIKGSLSARYGFTQGTQAFDVDRLFPGILFGNADVTVADIASPFADATRGSASLTFGVKVAQPGTSGVNISEASATFGVTIFTTPINLTPDVLLNAVNVKGNVDGQPFSVAYSRLNSAFKFNDYLFQSDGSTNNTQGVVATFSGTKFPLTPEVTLVTGVSPAFGPPNTYFGIRTVLKPFQGFNLALNYAANTGNRQALGLDTGLEVGPIKATGLFVTSKAGGPPADWFNNAVADWAYYVQGEATLGPISLSANYHAVDPQYMGGMASLSVTPSYPYSHNTQGLGLSASAALGPLSLKAYAESETQYNGGPGTYETSLGVALTLGSFAGFNLTGFYNAFYNAGNGYFDLSNPANNGGSYNNRYSYANENQKYSSSFGVRLVHDGKAKDALIPTLNLTAQYVRFYLPAAGYNDIQVYANLAQPFKLAFLSLSPGFRYHLFEGPAAPAGNYSTLKAGLQLSTDPLVFGLSLEGAVAYRQTDYTTLSVITRELYYRVGAKIQDFLAPKVTVQGGFARYEGDQLSGNVLVGNGNQAFSFDRDRIYSSPDPVPTPWTATPGTNQGYVEGFYLQATYYNLSVAYGEFVLNTTNISGAPTDFGRGFRISYSLNF